jgi:hypothetical protein
VRDLKKAASHSWPSNLGRFPELWVIVTRMPPRFSRSSLVRFSRLPSPLPPVSKPSRSHHIRPIVQVRPPTDSDPTSHLQDRV